MTLSVQPRRVLVNRQGVMGDEKSGWSILSGIRTANRRRCPRRVASGDRVNSLKGTRQKSGRNFGIWPARSGGQKTEDSEQTEHNPSSVFRHPSSGLGRSESFSSDWLPEP